jgi:hypothetical protein
MKRSQARGSKKGSKNLDYFVFRFYDFVRIDYESDVKKSKRATTSIQKRLLNDSFYAEYVILSRKQRIFDFVTQRRPRKQ